MSAPTLPDSPPGMEPGLPEYAALDDGWPTDAAPEAEADDIDPAAGDLPEPASLRRTASADDAQLTAWMLAIVDQDERALAALYDATCLRVFGMVQRIVRRAALAEEVVEDSYFQVWRHAARYDPARGSAITWLLAIARTRAIDAVRREARFEHDTLDIEQTERHAAAAPPGDELLDLARHRTDLHQALMSLGAQPRQLVSLAFFRGLSHEEIASQTCLPLGTVKSQIRRALQSLRQVLAHRGLAGLAS